MTSCNEFSPVGIHFQIPGAYVSMPYCSLSFVLREMKIAGIRKFVFDLHKRNGICIKISVRPAGQPADRLAAGGARSVKGS